MNLSKNNSVISKISSQVGSQTSIKQEQLVQRQRHRSRMIIFLLNRLYVSKMVQTWERVKLIPFRWLRIQQRMSTLVENVYKKKEYTDKWQGFQMIRRVALNMEEKEVALLKLTLKKQRATAIKLITAFFVGKRRINLFLIIKKLKQFGDWKQFKVNTSSRASLRIIIKIYNKKMRQYFNRLKDTRVIIQFVKRCKVMFRIVKEIRCQNMRWSFLKLRREMLRNKKEKVGEEIKELEEKLGGGEDQELKGLKEKQIELNQQLENLKKQKQEIAAGLQNEVKEAENRTQQMRQKIQDLKQQQQEMKQKIVQIDEQLKVPYSLEQIYQLCYQNFLWTISQNTDKTYSKEQLLRSLETPLVPIDLPIAQLKQENQVLKQLLSEYVVLYGEKKIPKGTKIELPYEYLVKQNNLLYKMLMTLLPNAQFLKDQLLKIKQTFQTVSSSLKQLNYK